MYAIRQDTEKKSETADNVMGRPLARRARASPSALFINITNIIFAFSKPIVRKSPCTNALAVCVRTFAGNRANLVSGSRLWNEAFSMCLVLGNRSRGDKTGTGQALSDAGQFLKWWATTEGDSLSGALECVCTASKTQNNSVDWPTSEVSRLHISTLNDWK